MGGVGVSKGFLKASLRQSGRAFGPAGYGTRERVPFRLGNFIETRARMGDAYWNRAPPGLWRGVFMSVI